jgi:hypothetical protein
MQRATEHPGGVRNQPGLLSQDVVRERSWALTLDMLPCRYGRLRRAGLRALMSCNVHRRMLLNRPSGYYRRNGMLENQLFLIICFKHKRILVKALDPSGELDATQQVDRDHSFFFARIIEEAVLYVLRWFIHLYSQALKK